MGQAVSESEQVEASRRGRSRLRLAIPARLMTVFGEQDALLRDLSLTGARLALTENVVAGKDALLTWSCGEAFGRIVWAANGHCGLRFDRLVPPQVLIATRELSDARPADREAQRLRDLARDWVAGRT